MTRRDRDVGSPTEFYRKPPAPSSRTLGTRFPAGVVSVPASCAFARSIRLRPTSSRGPASYFTLAIRPEGSWCSTPSPQPQHVHGAVAMSILDRLPRRTRPVGSDPAWWPTSDQRRARSAIGKGAYLISIPTTARVFRGAADAVCEPVIAPSRLSATAPPGTARRARAHLSAPRRLKRELLPPGGRRVAPMAHRVGTAGAATRPSGDPPPAR